MKKNNPIRGVLPIMLKAKIKLITLSAYTISNFATPPQKNILKKHDFFISLTIKANSFQFMFNVLYSQSLLR